MAGLQIPRSRVRIGITGEKGEHQVVDAPPDTLPLVRVLDFGDPSRRLPDARGGRLNLECSCGAGLRDVTPAEAEFWIRFHEWECPMVLYRVRAAGARPGPRRIELDVDRYLDWYWGGGA